MTNSEEQEALDAHAEAVERNEAVSAVAQCRCIRSEHVCEANAPVLGVLKGQYPSRTMPITGTPPRQDLDGDFLDEQHQDTGSA